MRGTWHLNSVSKKHSDAGPKFLKFYNFENSSSTSSRDIGRIRATMKAPNRSGETS
jgi:hypothetical protein